MLTRATRLLHRVLDALGDDIAAGTPVVGVEPSCLAVFRDELVKLLPDDARATRLAGQTFSLSEFVLRHPERLDTALAARGTDRHAPAAAAAKVQGHCHQRAAWGTDADVELLSVLGTDADVLRNGCCGLAGAFGFEADHYDVSMRIGEQGVFGQVRDADRDTAIVADGFSCRTQISHGTERTAVHLAELLRDAVVAGHPRPDVEPPQAVTADRTVRRGRRWRSAAAAVGAGVLALGWAARRRRR